MEDNDKINKLMTEHGYEVNTAKAYVEAKGKCTYCGEDLFAKLEIYYAAEIDHILPKSKCPEVAERGKNYTLSCNVCNRTKGKENVLKEGEDSSTMLTEHRQELIDRVKERIEQKKQEKEIEKTYEEVKKIIQG
jgi:predicted transcriptional regulator